jgi:hypothetical protein
MGLEELAKRLSDEQRIGLTPELTQRLGIASADVTRGRLMAQVEGDRSHLGVYFIGCYVIDDTDFWGDGEIYWWSIPVIKDTGGKVRKDVLYGLPNGMEPHRVGSLEWMTNISLARPPLLAVIPPGDAAEQLILRLGIYDDDRAPADLPGAMTKGLEAFAAVANGEFDGPEHIINPVRHAIWESLKAYQDDILIEQDLILRHGETSMFGRGLIGSLINSMARFYYFVADENTTQRFGPVTLHKGQVETVRFDTPLQGGGRLALFARGADVSCSAFGDLTTDTPFMNRVIERRQEANFADGFNIAGNGAAKFVAYYTPPDAV